MGWTWSLRFEGQGAMTAFPDNRYAHRGDYLLPEYNTRARAIAFAISRKAMSSTLSHNRPAALVSRDGMYFTEMGYVRRETNYYRRANNSFRRTNISESHLDQQQLGMVDED